MFLYFNRAASLREKTPRRVGTTSSLESWHLWVSPKETSIFEAPGAKTPHKTRPKLSFSNQKNNMCPIKGFQESHESHCFGHMPNLPISPISQLITRMTQARHFLRQPGIPMFFSLESMTAQDNAISTQWISPNYNISPTWISPEIYGDFPSKLRYQNWGAQVWGPSRYNLIRMNEPKTSHFLKFPLNIHHL